MKRKTLLLMALGCLSSPVHAMEEPAESAEQTGATLVAASDSSDSQKGDPNELLGAGVTAPFELSAGQLVAQSFAQHPQGDSADQSGDQSEGEEGKIDDPRPDFDEPQASGDGLGELLAAAEGKKSPVQGPEQELREAGGSRGVQVNEQQGSTAALEATASADSVLNEVLAADKERQLHHDIHGMSGTRFGSATALGSQDVQQSEGDNQPKAGANDVSGVAVKVPGVEIADAPTGSSCTEGTDGALASGAVQGLNDPLPEEGCAPGVLKTDAAQRPDEGPLRAHTLIIIHDVQAAEKRASQVEPEVVVDDSSGGAADQDTSSERETVPADASQVMVDTVRASGQPEDEVTTRVVERATEPLQAPRPSSYGEEDAATRAEFLNESATGVSAVTEGRPASDGDQHGSEVVAALGLAGWRTETASPHGPVGAVEYVPVEGGEQPGKRAVTFADQHAPAAGALQQKSPQEDEITKADSQSDRKGAKTNVLASAGRGLKAEDARGAAPKQPANDNDSQNTSWWRCCLPSKKNPGAEV